MNGTLSAEPWPASLEFHFDAPEGLEPHAMVPRQVSSGGVGEVGKSEVQERE
jgi:hypothetical protein